MKHISTVNRAISSNLKIASSLSIQVLKEQKQRILWEQHVFVFSADITKTTYDSMIEKVGDAVRGGEDEPTEEKEWLLFLILPPLVLMPWLTVRYPTSSGIFAI